MDQFEKLDTSRQVIYEKYEVLDHGYVKLIEYWGSDERIIEAARMSTYKGFMGWGPKDCICKNSEHPGCMWTRESDPDKPGMKRVVMVQCSKCNGTEQVSGDEKLLAYLWKNKHLTPFEMAGMTIEVQAPIFVFREWHRHRTQSYNELSARYTPVPDVNYDPGYPRLFMTGESKQSQNTGNQLTQDDALWWLRELRETYARLEIIYQDGLRIGIPKELARLIMPVGRYSRMRASANLRNWLHFLTLRNHSAAQWEIRQYAAVLDTIVQNLFPRTHMLFKEGVN